MINTNKIQCTHVGSLPRNKVLLKLLEEKEMGQLEDLDNFKKVVSQSIVDIVEKQKICGIDFYNDGENGKTSYTLYIKDRFAGVGISDFDGSSESVKHADLEDHPDFAEKLKLARTKIGVMWYERLGTPVCSGPISYEDKAPLEMDISNLQTASPNGETTSAFMNSASPGVLTKFVPDKYYNNEDQYIQALAEALKVEYEMIHNAGLILQIDAPDLGSARHNQYKRLTEKEFLRIAQRNIEALNYATENIPPERMRMHICWGNYEGPHTHDIPLVKVLPEAFKARPSGILFEGANPRHSHEWEELADIHIPDEKVLIPGVIDSTSNFVEHPKLVAQRICNFANIVGKERVIAGTDCGFATFAGEHNAIAPSIVWAKFKAMREGADIATEKLW